MTEANKGGEEVWEKGCRRREKIDEEEVEERKMKEKI